MNLHYHQLLIIIYIVYITKNNRRFMEILTFLTIFELFYYKFNDLPMY